MFDDLGIVDRILADGQMAMPIRSIAPDGQVTLGGAVPDVLRGRPDIPYPASLITPEWRTEEALRLLLETLGGKVEFDTTLVSLEQLDGDVVTATLLGGGTIRMVTTRWVVGCDGGHSVVRKQVGIGFTGETREQVRMLVADVEVDGLDREAWHLWRHQEGLVTLCPLPSTRVFQYQAGIAPGQDPSLDLANLQTILERRTRRANIRLHEPEWSSLWRANVRLADRYRASRVLLAGDAAHIHSPAGGQGMNTGIQVEAGMDGIVVSNHGGRQIAASVTSLQVLPKIVDAVGDRIVVFFDSGIRTGATWSKPSPWARRRCSSGARSSPDSPSEARPGSST